MASEIFDLIVLGAGPGGYVAAIRAAQLGLKVACIEKDPTLGGTCLNVGCIPSKALLDSSEHYHYAKTKLAKHGVVVGEVALDLGLMMKRKEAVVRQLTMGVASLFKKNKITSITGFGSLAGKSGEVFQVEVQTSQGKTLVQGKRIILATGSIPAPLRGVDFDGKDIVSSTEALSFSSVPAHLVVIGGGVIGLELGSVWNRLGSRVTVVEYLERLCPTIDSALSAELQKSLSKQGMEFKLKTQCLSASSKAGQITLKVKHRETGEEMEMLADKVLVATGRLPYTEKLGLESVGVKLNERKRIAVDEHFQTNVPGIFAIGDVIEGPMLAHKAEDEGVACAERMAGVAGHVNYNAIPWVIYTHPEVAGVGMTEEEARQKGFEIRTGQFPMIANGRAKAMDELEGFVKVIADAKTDRLLGLHVISARAGDLVQEAVSVIEFGGSAEDLARTCHSHPTLSEAVKEAAMAVDKRAIHF
jgi:dihydrolipoamide dehydrogenase